MSCEALGGCCLSIRMDGLRALALQWVGRVGFESKSVNFPEPQYIVLQNEDITFTSQACSEV